MLTYDLRSNSTRQEEISSDQLITEASAYWSTADAPALEADIFMSPASKKRIAANPQTMQRTASNFLDTKHDRENPKLGEETLQNGSAQKPLESSKSKTASADYTVSDKVDPLYHSGTDDEPQQLTHHKATPMERRPQTMQMRSRPNPIMGIPPGFRKILSIKSSLDRIATYNMAREYFAHPNTGLSTWLAATVAANPDSKSLANLATRPIMSTTGPSRHKPMVGGHSETLEYGEKNHRLFP